MNTNDRIVELCSGINGATMRQIADTLGIIIGNASGRLGNLQREGRVIKVRPPIKGAKCVFHAVPGWTRRPVGRPPAVSAPRPVERSLTRHGKRDALEPTVRLNIAGRLRGHREAIVTAATTRTQGPNWTHDPRYQCAPGEQPWGAGFAAAGIGRDVTTGKEWA